jgi:hypothetical protein
MIDRLSMVGSCIHVHVDEISLKTTKGFTHGGLAFDVATRTVTFGNLPAVALPDELALADGDTLSLQLVAPDGTLRKQTRSGVLRGNEKQPGILRIAGMSKTASKFSADDGWGHTVYKFRAYFTHPGVETSGGVPEWLKGSIARQKALWNHLAWLCREARRKCSPVPTEEIVSFVNETILPAIDAFNDALGRSKEKMKHPAKLKKDAPGLDVIWKFAGELRTRIEKDRPVPEGLLDKVVAFAQQYKPDYTPLNQFLNSLNEIAEQEAKALVMAKDAEPVECRNYEVRPTVKAFKAVLDRRKTTKAPWSEGWPLIKYPDSPKADNWGLHYYFNKAGVGGMLLETPKGVPGLTLGRPLSPSNTGHAKMTGSGQHSARKLREAEISIPGSEGERWNFRFAVLQHRALPAHSHIKEWKLIFSDGELWLCLVVELQRPVAAAGPVAAGLEIGWRRTEDGIRFGTIYEPQSHTFRELTIDFNRSPKDHSDRGPFRIDLGPTRWEKRNILTLRPDWKPGDPIPSYFETRTALNERRSYLKDTAKVLLRKHLGDKLPVWFDKAGKKGLIKLQEEFKDDSTVQDILNTWQAGNAELERIVPMYFERSTKRIEYGQAQVAHDVCRYLQQKGTSHLIVESSFVAKVAQTQDNNDPDALKNSHKYRQLAATSRFVSLLKNTAIKYGIAVDDHVAINITRLCHHCNHLNAATEKETFSCENCNMVLNQDQNAAINLSRFGKDPELAEMAMHTAPNYLKR